jgi:hypothetical protein
MRAVLQAKLNAWRARNGCAPPIVEIVAAAPAQALSLATITEEEQQSIMRLLAEIRGKAAKE